MPRFPEMGVKAVVDGVGDFITDMGRMDKATRETHEKIGSLGGATISGGGLTASIGSVVGAIGTITTAALAAIGAVAGIGIALGALAEQGAALVDTRKQFEALVTAKGGDPAKKIDELRMATRGLVSDQDLMQTYVKSYALLGENADALIPLLPQVVDRAVALGLDPQQAISDLTNGISRNSTEVLDNLGIVVKAEEANKAYADSIGVTADQLTGQQQQTALLNAAQQSLAATAKDIVPANETMTGSWKAMDIALANLKDTALAGIAEAFAPMLPVLTDLVQTVMPLLTNFIATVLVPALSTAFTWLSEKIPLALETLQGWWETVSGALSEKTGVFQTVVVPILQDLWKSLTDIWDVIATNVIPEWERLWAILEPVVLPLLQSLALTVGLLLLGALKGLALLLTNVVVPAFRGWVNFLRTYVWPVVEGIATVITGIIQAIGDLGTALRNAPETVGKALENLIPDWMKPGSPSPLEQSLARAGKAIQALRRDATIGLQHTATMTVSAALSGLAGSSQSVTNNFNQTINTRAPAEPIAADFRMMRALAQTQ